MINFFKTTSARNTSFLNYCYIGIVLNFAIYLYKINYELELQKYNNLLVIQLLLVLLSPFIDFIIRKKEPNSDLGVRFFLYTSTFNLITLIYFGGGIGAPGIFWLSAVPITYGFILHTKGLRLGFAVSIATLVIFNFSNYLGLPQFQLKMEIFHRELIFNSISFIVYLYFITIFYFKREEDYLIDLKTRNEESVSLLHILTHDVANPLAVIEMNLNHLSTDLSNAEKLKKGFDRIKKSSTDLTHLLADIRQLMAIQAGKMELKKNPVSIKQSVREVVESNSFRLDMKGVSVDIDIPVDLKIYGDETLFKGVIINNLLTNAIKFSSEGQVISISARELSTDEICIEIRDQGVGISEEVIPSLFLKNVKTTTFGTKGEKGTGFGLPLVKDFTEKMNGRIQITSKLASKEVSDHGTTVQLTFKNLM